MDTAQASSANRPVTPRIDVLSVLAVAVAAAFAAAFAASVGAITTAFTWNADFVSPMVLAERLGKAHGSHEVVFGTYGPVTTLWFNVVTRQLPAHQVVWKLGPLMLALAALASVGWAVSEVGGRWAALLALAVGFCWSTPVLTTLVAQADHGPTYVVMCLLGAFLVFLATRAVTPGVVAVGVLLAIVAGLNLASDPLLLLVGIAPFVGSALLVLAHRRSRVRRPWEHGLALGGSSELTLAVVVTGLALAVAGVTAKAVHSAGYSVLGVSQGNPLTLATRSELWKNLGHVGQNVLVVFNADFWNATDATAPVRVMLAGLAVVGLAIPIVLLVRRVSRRGRWASGAEGEDTALALWQVYWGLTVASLIVGLVFSRLAVENAPRSLGYSTPLFLGVAMIVPVVAARTFRGRAIVSAGAILFCGLSLLSVARQEILHKFDEVTYVKDGDALLRVLEDNGLHRGYAGYASAAPLTFRSDGRVEVFPVILCSAGQDRFTLCGFPANRVKSWYKPRDEPSFVVADAAIPFAIPAPPPGDLGEPSQVLTVGSQTVFVYPYDVASRFGPTL